MDIEISARLEKIGPLSGGAHPGHDAMCVMEAVAYVAGEPWSDNPECACPVISAFLRVWNDDLPDSERDALLRPLIPRLLNTRNESLERRRAMMAADWLIRTHTPAWLRLAGLDKQADALVGLPEITDMAQCPSLMPVLNAAREDAAVARAAARDVAMAAARDVAMAAARDVAMAAAWDAARDVAWDAAWVAARAAARDVAMAAARDVAMAAAWDAARDVARAAARAAARDAARAAARDALSETKKWLQQSALELVNRMIEART